MKIAVSRPGLQRNASNQSMGSYPSSQRRSKNASNQSGGSISSSGVR